MKLAAQITLTPGTVISRLISADRSASEAIWRSTVAISESRNSMWRRHASIVSDSSSGRSSSRATAGAARRAARLANVRSRRRRRDHHHDGVRALLLRGDGPRPPGSERPIASIGSFGHHRIERLSTSDDGRSWRRTWITSGGTDNIRPIVPRGLPPGDEEVLWMRGRYGRFQDPETSIVALT